ncbi:MULTISPECIES: hypothetical protein [unclassified Bradyrhizobium]|uniref:hypothetical protein n=1 Tax=unclassified Bradyrhizobium TaxID=2631580 RepID=UPI0028EF9CC2|nr:MULTISPECIES: hypothetical protein [unclassified Bradyrhizobium]
MRLLIAASLIFATLATPALAAPPASCASKFVGEWRHSGSGNRGSVKADGRALCSEHPACVQGTWTCSGNVLTYTNSLGTWNYTLAPDGKSMSTGTATATRIGPAPASARSRASDTVADAPDRACKAGNIASLQAHDDRLKGLWQRASEREQCGPILALGRKRIELLKQINSGSCGKESVQIGASNEMTKVASVMSKCDQTYTPSDPGILRRAGGTIRGFVKDHVLKCEPTSENNNCAPKPQRNGGPGVRG